MTGLFNDSVRTREEIRRQERSALTPEQFEMSIQHMKETRAESERISHEEETLP